MSRGPIEAFFQNRHRAADSRFPRLMSRGPIEAHHHAHDPE